MKASAQKAQRGVVLIMSLILLVVISLIAVMGVRSSISGEQVSKGLRTSVAATQAAETALRYCEDNVLSGGNLVKINLLPVTGDPVLWQSRANWLIPTLVTPVPEAIVNSTDANARQLPASALPLCMIEEYPLLAMKGATPRNSYLVTAIGRSADYQALAGKLVSGSEVWLQSVIRR